MKASSAGKWTGKSKRISPKIAKLKNKMIQDCKKQTIGNAVSQSQMITTKWEKKILEIMQYLFFALPFFALLDFQSLFRSEIFTKLMFFYLVVEILSFFYMLLILQNKCYLPSFFSNINGIRKKNWILIAVTAYVAIVAITNLFSINPYKSFFGTITWENGFLTLLHFFVLFVILSAYGRSPAGRKNVYF